MRNSKIQGPRKRSVFKKVENHSNTQQEILFLKNENRKLGRRLLENDQMISSLRSQLRLVQKHGERDNFAKQFDAEHSKNIFLENENMQLHVQIKKMNEQYKSLMDQKNSLKVGNFSYRKDPGNSKSENLHFQKKLVEENKYLKQQLDSYNSKKKSFSEKETKQMHISNNNFEKLENQCRQLEKNNYELQEQMNNLIKEKKSQEQDFEEYKNENDRIVDLYQQMNRDMKKECQIYSQKLKEMVNQQHLDNYQMHSMHRSSRKNSKKYSFIIE